MSITESFFKVGKLDDKFGLPLDYAAVGNEILECLSRHEEISYCDALQVLEAVRKVIHVTASEQAINPEALRVHSRRKAFDFSH